MDEATVLRNLLLKEIKKSIEFRREIIELHLEIMKETTHSDDTVIMRVRQMIIEFDEKHKGEV